MYNYITKSDAILYGILLQNCANLQYNPVQGSDSEGFVPPKGSAFFKENAVFFYFSIRFLSGFRAVFCGMRLGYQEELKYHKHSESGDNYYETLKLSQSHLPVCALVSVLMLIKYERKSLYKCFVAVSDARSFICNTTRDCSRYSISTLAPQ